MARKNKQPETLEEMIEALKVFGEQTGDDKDKEKEKLKLTVDQFKYAMCNMGEKMLEH